MPFDPYHNGHDTRRGRRRLPEPSAKSRSDSLSESEIDGIVETVRTHLRHMNFHLVRRTIDAAEDQALVRREPRVARSDAMAVAELQFADSACGQRIVNALEEYLDVVMVSQLRMQTREELLPLPNFGMKSLELLADAMRRVGYKSWADRLEGKSSHED